jgi:hypothetical protein
MSIDFGAAIPEELRPKVSPPALYQPLDLDQAKARFADYIEKIDSILQQGEMLFVDTESTNEEAVNIGTSAKHLYKKIEDQRKEIIEQPSEFVKSVNSFCKIFTERLLSIEAMMKGKISQYRAIEEQRRREAELAAKKAAEELQKKLDFEAKQKGTEPVKVETPIIPKQETVTRSETGTAYGRKVWSFKITDTRAVPREYLVVSDSLIRDAVKAGVRSIPGVEIFEEIRTSFRT